MKLVKKGLVALLAVATVLSFSSCAEEPVHVHHHHTRTRTVTPQKKKEFTVVNQYDTQDR